MPSFEAKGEIVIPDARFARHALIPGWKQERLGNACIIVAGVGATGNAVAQALALSGVGHLILCDPDHIEESNLSRTPLFGPDDLGQPKVLAAKRSLEAQWPGIRITTHIGRFEDCLGLGKLNSIDLVMSCLDSRIARFNLAARCRLVLAPVIDGGTSAWAGEIRPFLDADGPCYSCTLSAKDRGQSDTPWSCLDAGDDGRPEPSAAPSSLLVGSWMAMLGVRYLLGEDVGSHFIKINGVTGSAHPVAIRRDPHCPLHDPISVIGEYQLHHAATIQELLALLPNGTRPHLPRPVRIHEGQATQLIPTTGDLAGTGTSDLTELPSDFRFFDLGLPEDEVVTFSEGGISKGIVVKGGRNKDG